MQDSINSIAEEIDENKLRDLLYILCVRRPLLSTDLEYIKGKLNVLDEIHDSRNEIIEYVKRLVEILSKGSKRDRSYSVILSNWCNGIKLSTIQVADTEIQKKSIDFGVIHWDDCKIENLAKIFLKSESYEKKKYIIYNNKGYLREIQRCRMDSREYSEYSIHLYK